MSEVKAGNPDPKTIEAFLRSPEGEALFYEAVELYNKVEREHAHMARVNGIDIGYLDFGPSDATPLIWLHGSGATGYEIFNVQAGLVDAGYRVIAPDYRGHGKTQVAITDYNCSLYHIADDICALMDYLNIDKAVIGGLSKGGWIAAAFYSTYMDRVLGLLLEDGGSFSKFRLADDTQLKVVKPGLSPYPAEDLKKVSDSSARFKTQREGVIAMCKAYLPAFSERFFHESLLEFITGTVSGLRHNDDGTWQVRCDLKSLMTSESAGRPVDAETSSTTLYSRLPMMQRSQELIDPFVVFRNLHVPMCIIDPDSPTDRLPVRHQNEELQKLHPDLIVHEIYDYEHSPHEAHYERPERFINDAKALLGRVMSHSVTNGE